jgi:hypothetical protein
MRSQLRTSEKAADAPGVAGACGAPGASSGSVLERLRGRLRARALDPFDPLAGLTPLIDSLRSANEMLPRTVPTAPTASTAAGAPRPAAPPSTLEELLAGGLPRGQLVEMIGARSSGRFSTVLTVLAAATLAGEAAALVDLGDGLDPQAAAALGVDLRRLLWLRPTTLKQALAGAEILIGGGFPMVVLDLGNPPLRGGRGGEAGWLRLARAAQAQRTALLVASPYRVSGTAATIVLQAARGRARWLGMSGRAPWLLDGLSCQVAIEKCRGRRLPAGALGLELRLAPLVAAPPPSPAAVGGAAAPDFPGAGARWFGDPLIAGRPAAAPASSSLTGADAAPAEASLPAPDSLPIPDSHPRRRQARRS